MELEPWRGKSRTRFSPTRRHRPAPKLSRPTTSEASPAGPCGLPLWRGCHHRAGSGGSGRSGRATPFPLAPGGAHRQSGPFPDGRHHKTSRGESDRTRRGGAPLPEAPAPLGLPLDCLTPSWRFGRCFHLEPRRRWATEGLAAGQEQCARTGGVRCKGLANTCNQRERSMDD